MYHITRILVCYDLESSWSLQLVKSFETINQGHHLFDSDVSLFCLKKAPYTLDTGFLGAISPYKASFTILWSGAECTKGTTWLKCTCLAYQSNSWTRNGNDGNMVVERMLLLILDLPEISLQFPCMKPCIRDHENGWSCEPKGKCLNCGYLLGSPEKILRKKESGNISLA